MQLRMNARVLTVDEGSQQALTHVQAPVYLTSTIGWTQGKMPQLVPGSCVAWMLATTARTWWRLREGRLWVTASWGHTAR